MTMHADTVEQNRVDKAIAGVLRQWWEHSTRPTNLHNSYHPEKQKYFHIIPPPPHFHGGVQQIATLSPIQCFQLTYLIPEQ